MIEGERGMYHVFWLFWEESNSARAIALNILLHKAHLCRKIFEESSLGTISIVSRRTTYSYRSKYLATDASIIIIWDSSGSFIDGYKPFFQ